MITSSLSLRLAVKLNAIAGYNTVIAEAARRQMVDATAVVPDDAAGAGRSRI
tara:strand:+ start:2605 stop:2760 length:156 start_codon:yes stop_codon:yes gene_type:complete